MEAYIEHKPVDCFLMNTHTFHNAHLIWAVLPRDLIAPVPFVADHWVHHNEIAQTLHANQESKWAATALKAVERKKAAALKKSDAGGVPGQETVGSGSQKRKQGQGNKNKDDMEGRPSS
jgi:hypothetical protein